MTTSTEANAVLKEKGRDDKEWIRKEGRGGTLLTRK
jgi:hypothetical protein